MSGQPNFSKGAWALEDFESLDVEFRSDVLLHPDGRQIMMGWEREIMRVHAEAVCKADGGGDILEIGFGLGISASYIQALRPRSHTIVEPNPHVLRRLRAFARVHPNVRVIAGKWWDVREQLGRYDGIFYDTYDDRHRRAFPRTVAKTLRPDGVFSFYNNIPERKNRFCLAADYIPVGVEPPPNDYFNARTYYVPVVTTLRKVRS